MATHFTGAVTSTNGFVGDVSATTLTASTSLAVGATSPATIKGIYSSTVSVTIATDAAAAEEDISLTITGVAAGDLVLLAPNNSSMETGVGIVAVWVSGANTVKVRISNFHTSALAGSTANWNYVWFDLT